MDREKIGTTLYVIGMLLVVAGVVIQYWAIARPDVAPAAPAQRVPIETEDEAEPGTPAAPAESEGAS